MAIKIALAGNPNCGKTTMFNALTGANQYVGNWPGVTVEKKDLSKLKQEYVDATAQYGKHSSEAKSLKSQIEDLSKKIADEEITVKKASESADAFDKSMKNAGDSAKDAGNKV